MRAEAAKEIESSEWEIVNGGGPAAYLGFHLSGRGKRWDDAAAGGEVKSSRNFSVTSLRLSAVHKGVSLLLKSEDPTTVIDSFY